MAKPNRVTTELIVLTALCAVITLVAMIMAHERRVLMLLLTGMMASLACVAQFRHHRGVRTLKGVRGRRKRHPKG